MHGDSLTGSIMCWRCGHAHWSRLDAYLDLLDHMEAGLPGSEHGLNRLLLELVEFGDVLYPVDYSQPVLKEAHRYRGWGMDKLRHEIAKGW